jgi:hypothetical protein
MPTNLAISSGETAGIILYARSLSKNDKYFWKDILTG